MNDPECGHPQKYSDFHNKFLNSQVSHSVSKVHFLSKNYKFLNILKVFIFVSKLTTYIWIFDPKLVKKLSFHHGFIWAILDQNRDFWPKVSNIGYILESKIQEFYWILAQKFKLDDLRDFVKIRYLDKNWTFDTV